MIPANGVSAPLLSSLTVFPLWFRPLVLQINIFALGIVGYIGICHDFLCEILSSVSFNQTAGVELRASLDDGSHLQYFSLEAIRRFVKLLGI